MISFNFFIMLSFLFILLNAYAPSSYFVFTHHSQDFHYNTFYLFHNLVILSFYVLQHKITRFCFLLYAYESKIYAKGTNS